MVSGSGDRMMSVAVGSAAAAVVVAAVCRTDSDWASVAAQRHRGE